RLQLLPFLVEQFLDGRQVQLLAVECDAVHIHAQDAGSTAAEVNAAAGDGRRSFEVYQRAGDGQLPDHPSLVHLQTVQDGAVGLVHAVAEDEFAVVEGGRTDGRQFQIRRALGPGDALGGLRIGIETGKGRHVEATKSGYKQAVLGGDGGGD